MGRGTTVDYSVNGTKIIKRAFIWSGIYGVNSPAPPEENADALDVFNMMVKLWMGSPDIETKGLKMWQRERASLTLKSQIYLDLQVSGGDVDMNPPVEIITAMLKTTSNEETPITRMMGGLAEFEAIPDKTQTGTISKFYYERGYDKGTIYWDIIPSDTTDVVDIVYLRPLYDMDAFTNDVDFPQHWYEALYMNLGLRLMPGYEKQIDQERKNQAQYALAKAQNFYPENTDMYFQPGIDE